MTPASMVMTNATFLKESCNYNTDSVITVAVCVNALGERMFIIGIKEHFNLLMPMTE